MSAALLRLGAWGRSRISTNEQHPTDQKSQDDVRTEQAEAGPRAEWISAPW